MRFIGDKKKTSETTTNEEIKSVRNGSEMERRIGPNNMCGPRKFLKREEITGNTFTIIIERDVSRQKVFIEEAKQYRVGKGKSIKDSTYRRRRGLNCQ